MSALADLPGLGAVWRFYLLVAGTVVGLVVLARLGGSAAGVLAYAALVVAVATTVALWRVVRLEPDDGTGLVVPRDAAPRLWAAVDDLAAEVDTRPPDEIRVVPEVNAAVSERARLLGLVGGRRTLLVGLPLLQTFTMSQLRAVLAHEMGHYSHSHTRLAAVTYRGRVTMIAIIAHVGPHNLVGLLFTQYARLFFLVEAAVSRRQEVEADRAAARIAGRAAAMSALADLPGLGAVWRFYLDRYVGRGLRFGYAPDALFLGFPQLVAARADELAKARSNPAEPERSRWDSHPPIADRLAAIAAMPEDAAMVDDGPAHVLVPDLAALAGRLDSLVLRPDGQERLPWDEYLARVAEAELTGAAAALLGEFARQTGRDSASAADLVDTVGTPTYDGFVRAVLPPGIAADPAAGNGPLATVIAACAVRSGVAHGMQSWSSGPAVLVGGDGERFDAEGIAARLADPGTAAAAREELRERGIRLDPTADRAQTAEEGRPLGAVSNVVVDGKRRDLVIYDTGLLVVPGSPRRRMRQSLKRLHKVATESTVEELRSTPGSRYVPFHEVVECAPDRKSLLAQVVTLIGGMTTSSGGQAFAFALTLTGGDVVRMRWGMETEFLGGSSDVLASCVAQLSAHRPAGAQADASG